MSRDPQRDHPFSRQEPLDSPRGDDDTASPDADGDGDLLVHVERHLRDPLTA